MAQIYSLVIALFARLIMVGLGALFLWGASFYGSILLSPIGRQAVATNHFTQTETNWAALSTVGGLGIGLAIAGLLLLFFGLRGLWRRVAAGMPAEDEHAETPVGRLGSAAIFGAGALLGLLRLTLLLYAIGDQVVLQWTGIETSALVERKWRGDWAPPGTDQPPRIAYQLAIAFRAEDGGTIHQEKRVSGSFYHAVEEGSSIQVTYARQDPNDASLEFIGPRRVLIEAFIWIGLISAGLWGVRRNLGSDGSGVGGGHMAGSKPPLPPAPRTPAAPARRQFGQRTL